MQGGISGTVPDAAGRSGSLISTSSAGAHSHGGATGSVGSGSAHNNLQPYITINYIIKY
mgnify:CR=1 FL=1